MAEKAKLSLNAPVTFRATVAIPVAGSKPIDVEFEFRHRTKSQLTAWISERAGAPDIDSFLDMVVAWPGLTDEFNRENVDRLLETHAGAATATYIRYIDELTGAQRLRSIG